MRAIILTFLLAITFQIGMAQNATGSEQAVLQLSKDKWQWMSDKDVAKLEPLFHNDSRFVHMGGTWGKAKELEIIKSGSIWYKKAYVHDVLIKTFDKNTFIVWSRITLNSEVGGKDVTVEFTVTEIYQKKGKSYQLLDLTFSSVRDTHALEH
jgi:4-carboxymuconolactone decarboxylase